MKKADFYFDLPKDLIASEPLAQRSASRLMCLNKVGEIAHHHYTDLPELLQLGDLLVFNNSKVIPARLYAVKPTGGKIEILIERVLEDGFTALAHVKGAKSLKEEGEIFLEMSSRANPSEPMAKEEQSRDLPPHIAKPIQGDPSTSASQSEAFGRDDSVIKIGPRKDDLLTLTASYNWFELMETYGHMPLPPYMEREDRAQDRNRYQTVYANEEKKGSVAAPTAGLHFDEALLESLKQKGIKSVFVTLHVGAGTFQPVREENIHNHKMHTEYYEITQDVIDTIEQTKQSGGRVIAVGTTSVRVLESVFKDNGIMGSREDVIQQTSYNLNISPSQHLHRGETDIFIIPGYEFQIIDGLITNFHLPESTLIMLVSALIGRENILNAYNVAVEERYRFFSYGDGMLLL